MSRARASTNSKSFLEYLKPHAVTWVVILAALCGSAAMELARPWPFKFVIDYLTRDPTTPLGGPFSLPPWMTASLPRFLGAIGSSILLIAAGQGLFSFVSTYLQKRVGEATVATLRRHLFARVLNMSLRAHRSLRVGEISQRAIKDTADIKELLTTTLGSLFKGTVQLVSVCAVMLWMDWQMALLALCLAPVLLIVARAYMRKIRTASRKHRRREGLLAAMVHETIASIETVKAFNRETFTERLLADEVEANVETSLAATRLEAQLVPGVQIVSAVGAVVVICGGVYRVTRGALSPGDLWVFLSYLKAFQRPMRDLTKQVRRWAHAQVCWEKIREFLSDESELAESRPRAPGFSGAIDFVGVDFAYDKRTPLLRGVNLSVEPGQKVAFIGPTGSGKTTLVGLLGALYEPTHGEIRIDAHSIHDYDPSSVRTQMSFVPQDTLLFRGSIYENIAYGRLDASRAEIEEAARAAKIHGFVESLPRGYESIIGERGASLSGGQRQRIAIARAALRNTPILILDEPTSALDPATGAAVWNELLELMRGRTTILISHQLHLARDMDRVFHVKGGRVWEAAEYSRSLSEVIRMDPHGRGHRQQYRADRARDGFEPEASPGPIDDHPGPR